MMGASGIAPKALDKYLHRDELVRLCGELRSGHIRFAPFPKGQRRLIKRDCHSPSMRLFGSLQL
jgi:hypothetical protein